MALFIVLTVIGAVVAVGIVAIPLWRRAGEAGRRRSLPLAIAVTMPVAIAFLYLVSSNYDWRSPPTPPSAVTADAAVAQLEAQLRASPSDLEGWLMLGNSYVTLGRPAEAVGAYQQALDVSGGEHMGALLGRAEAEILADPEAATGRAADDIETVLAAEPRNPKALWYGGLLALGRDDISAARERWGALLALNPPASVRQILESQLAVLDEGGAAPPSATQTPAGRAFQVRVSLGEQLQDQVSATAPLFVFVRDAAAQGPPLAVIRRQASELPLTVNISDADVMIPGRSLASLDRAQLVARIANGGDPVAKPGDAFGEAAWSSADEAAGTIDIVIDQVVAP